MIMMYHQFNMEDFLNDEFFIKWVKSPDEETDHFWLKWIAEHPEKVQLIQQAKEIILMVDYKEKYFLSNKAYTDLYENIIKDTKTKESSKVNAVKWRTWHKVAAILLVLFSSVYCFKYSLEWGKDISLSEEEMIIKCNPAGQKSSFRLPDGTVVYLHGNSKLSYPPFFSDDVRKVKMEGEAYFEVKQDLDKPFIVDLGKDQIRVTGTAFNICSHKGFVSLALVEGSVTYAPENGTFEKLVPNQMLTKVPTGKVTKKQFDPLEVCGWKDKYLIFKDDSFAMMVAKLERWYGVTISAHLKLESDWSYSGTYHDKSLEYVLDGIGIASQFAYEIEGKNVTIYNPNQP